MKLHYLFFHHALVSRMEYIRIEIFSFCNYIFHENFLYAYEHLSVKNIDTLTLF
jgi:hypothetical protein